MLVYEKRVLRLTLYVVRGLSNVKRTTYNVQLYATDSAYFL
jgi:hypothetical protein